MQPDVAASLAVISRDKPIIGILDLPDELLLQLIDNLCANDLYTLILLCRRLRRLAIPAYLQRHNLIAPGTRVPCSRITLVGAELHVLPGLQFASFIQGIKSVSCEFGPYESANDLAIVIRRLHRLILRIDTLHSLALGFDYCDLKLLSTQDAHTNSWTEACTALLTCAVQRCVLLILVYQGTLVDIPKLDLIKKDVAKWRHASSRFSRPFKILKGFSFGKQGSYPSKSDETRVPSERTACTLRTLQVRSTAFFLPPLLTWTLHTLNTVPLTKLYLVGLSLPMLAKDCIFPSIHIPTLQFLSIDDCNMSSYHFADFLSRHSGLSSFDHKPDYLFGTLPSLPKSVWPQLGVLGSDPDNIVRLLEPASALPKLMEVRIFIETRFNRQFVFPVVEDSLAKVARRLTASNIRLGLFVSASSLSNNWINLDNVDNIDNYLVLRRIRFIVFDFRNRDVVTNLLIPTWFSMFPLLDHISFMNGTDDFSRDIEISLLRRIVQEHPGIRTAWIGETRHVSDWFSSET